MRKSLTILIMTASLALFTGCGGDDPDTGTATSPAGQSSSDDGASEEPTSDDGASEGTASTVLTATTGSESDPDAFVITLTDESGADVTSLPAGDYTINVSDFSAMHNFHLTGGSVNESTTVGEITNVTWEVTLEPGDYTFRCDPHPNMVGGFTVE